MLIALTALSLALSAIGLVQAGGARDPAIADNQDVSGCLPPTVAHGAQIVAIGTYEGATPTQKTMTHDGHRVKAVVVSSAPQGKPLVLVLTAYDPVVWDLRFVSKRRLRAVLVSGYHAQAVVGAARAPVQISGYGRPESACGELGYAYKGGSNLEQLDFTVRKLFGRGIDRFIGRYALKSARIDGGRGRLPVAVALAGAIGAEAYKAGPAIDGPLALQRLQARGFIRRATRADIQRLVRVLTKRSPTGHLAVVRPYVYQAYVVLRPIQVPTGMYGGHSVTFLIPRGVPFPKDSGSHNTYWSLATGECRGPGCSVDD